MANQDAIQDRNQFPALTAHTGTAGTADVVRVVATAAGALSVDIVSGDSINIGTLTLGTIATVNNIEGGTVDSPKYQLRMDSTTTTNITYVGEANVGSATSDACWRIKKIDETTSDVLIITWAGTTTAFTQVWDNRSSLGYA